YPAVLAAPPSIGGVTPNLFVMDPKFVDPVSHQWSLNLESQIGRNASVTLGYLGVHGEHLSHTRDINLFPAVATLGSFSDGTPVTFFRHPGTTGPARPNPNFGRISLNDSGADSIYHGGFIQFTKRYAGHFQLLTSYTFSKVIDSVPEQTAVVVPVDDSKYVQDTLNPNLDRGLGDADIRHRFTLAGVWDVTYAHSMSNPIARALLDGYQLAMINAIQSGRHFSPTVGSDPNNNSMTATD